jgi:peptide deformylase
MSGKPEEKNEGCLSLPGVTEIVHRFPEVLIEAQNTEGEWGKYHFTGLEAQCVQHEHEHLDGIIIPDKLSAWRRERLRKQLAKARK